MPEQKTVLVDLDNVLISGAISGSVHARLEILDREPVEEDFLPMPTDAVRIEHLGMLAGNDSRLRSYFRPAVSAALRAAKEDHAARIFWCSSWLAGAAERLDAVAELIGLADVIERPGAHELPVTPVNEALPPMVRPGAAWHWKMAAVDRALLLGGEVLWLEDQTSRLLVTSAQFSNFSRLSVIVPNGQAPDYGVLSDRDLAGVRSFLDGHQVLRWAERPWDDHAAED